MKANIITKTNTVLELQDVNLQSRCNNKWILQLIVQTSTSWETLHFTLATAYHFGQMECM
jgi:hypothetical protein